MPKREKRRRWTLTGSDGRPTEYEEVTGEEWDRLPESQRQILHLPAQQGVAYVRKVGGPR